MIAEFCGNAGYLRYGRMDYEKFPEALSAARREGLDTGALDLLGWVLGAQNLNDAYKHVRSNKGAPGVDGMTVDEARLWLREHRWEIIHDLQSGYYRPSPVKRVEIPKPDGGVRKLGIPTVIDRVVQQAVSQILTPIYDPMFSVHSHAYRPHRSIQTAIKEVLGYAQEGYVYAAQIDLSKYFDTINHDTLLNLIRKTIHDKRIVELIKKFLKSGVMEDGLCRRTEEGSPQGGNISPLLSNIYLDVFDKEMERRGVRFVRYADDICLLAKSERAAKRQLASASRFLVDKLKLTVNPTKSKVVHVINGNEFKFVGFTLGRFKTDVIIRVHPKGVKKAKDKLRELTVKSRGRSVQTVMKEVEQFARGWISAFGIARLKSILRELDGWLRRRIRVYIWKQWKLPKKRERELIKLGADPEEAHMWSYRKGYWRVAGDVVLTTTLTNKKLERMGYFNMSAYYASHYG